MDEARMREQCEAILKNRFPNIKELKASADEMAFYRAAYADGLIVAARMAREHQCHLACNCRVEIALSIRQHAKEMGHE